MIKRIFSIPCFLILSFLCTVTPASGQKLTVGVYDFYPICHSHQLFDPSNINFFPNILDYIAQQEGWTLQYVPGKLNDLLMQLQSNDIDLVVAVPFVPKETPSIRFTGENVISTWAQIYAHKEVNIDTILDLSARSVGVLRDDPYNLKIRQMINGFGLNCQVLEFKHYEDLMQGLEKHWVDTAVVERLTGSIYEKQFQMIKTPIVFSPLELRFAAGSHIDANVLSAMDYYLRELKHNPDSIYHHLLNTIMIQPESSPLARWLPWALAVASILTMIALFTSLIFKRQVAKKINELSRTNRQLKEEIRSREKAEYALQQSNLLNQKTLANMKDGLLLLDPTGNKIIKANHAAAKMFGFTDKMIIHALPDRLHAKPENASLFFEAIRTAVAEKGFFSGLWQLQRKSGDIFPADISVTPISLNGNSQTHSWVVIIRDITEKVKAEKELEQSKIQLDQAKKLESIGRLAGGVAHDFNNLLMGIQGRTSLMMLNTKPSSRHSMYLAEIEECVATASKLVGQLLGFARGGKYEIKVTDINELLSATAEMFGRTRKEITIRKLLCKNPWCLEVDQGQIKQVFLNMFVNAWQAMPGGGILTLKTENTELSSKLNHLINLNAGKYVKISIEDNGIGMNDETREHIFEPFFTTKEMGRGTGLGLASAYGIIQNHHGAISVYSKKNVGTTFEIYLPATDKALEESQTHQESIQRGKETILLVDDEKVVISVGVEMLESLGYHVLVANNGQEALNIYTENQGVIDMVILDIIMPVMSGKDVFTHLKRLNPGIKVLLSSGYSLDDQAVGIMEQGCSGFIQKPFSIKQLSVKIREVIG